MIEYRGELMNCIAVGIGRVTAGTVGVDLGCPWGQGEEAVRLVRCDCGPATASQQSQAK